MGHGSSDRVPHPSIPVPYPSHPILYSTSPYTLPAAPIYASNLSTAAVLFRIACLMVVASSLVAFLSYCEGKITASITGIWDVAFALTEPLYQFLRDNTVIKDVICFSIGCTYAILLLYSAWISARYEQYGLFVSGVAIMLLRIVVAACTTLPIPAEFIASDYDIPPTTLQWAGSATREDKGFSSFITFYSGHTALVTLFTYFAAARLGRGVSRFSAIFLVVQALYMFASRGHYVIDIVAGFAVGRKFASYVPAINRELYRWSVFNKFLMSTEPEGWNDPVHIASRRRLSLNVKSSAVAAVPAAFDAAFPTTAKNGAPKEISAIPSPENGAGLAHRRSGLTSPSSSEED